MPDPPNYPPLPGINYVCAGYDPFLGYADSRNIVSTIVDWSKATQNYFNYDDTGYTKPAIISALNQSQSYLSTTVGQDIQSYQSNLAANVNISGSYNFFSGSISTDFSEHNIYKSENSFSRTHQSVSTWSLQVTVNSSIRGFLRSDFIYDLDNLVTSDDSCKNFFTKYGSHLLTGIVLGGRAMRTASTNKYSVDRSYSLDITAREACKFASGSVDAEERARYNNAVSSFESNSDVFESVIGGDPVLAAAVFDSKVNSDGNSFSAWATSVAKQPALIDFIGNSLTPIWELCAQDGNGPQIRSALQNYFNNKWAQLRSDQLTRRPMFINALAVVTGDNSETAAPVGYTRIDLDLNRGAGGKWIYAAYHKEPYNILSSSQQAVVGIGVFDQDEVNSMPPGWTVIPHDLNEGAGGEFVYLGYKMGPYDENTALLDLTVIGSSNRVVSPPYGYTLLPKDLNKGAGGEYVYFAVAKRNSTT